MSLYFSDLVRYTEHMGPQQWFWTLAIVIVVGVLCLRGLGSGSRY